MIEKLYWGTAAFAFLKAMHAQVNDTAIESLWAFCPGGFTTDNNTSSSAAFGSFGL